MSRLPELLKAAHEELSGLNPASGKFCSHVRRICEEIDSLRPGLKAQSSPPSNFPWIIVTGTDDPARDFSAGYFFSPETRMISLTIDIFTGGTSSQNVASMRSELLGELPSDLEGLGVRPDLGNSAHAISLTDAVAAAVTYGSAEDYADAEHQLLSYVDAAESIELPRLAGTRRTPRRRAWEPPEFSNVRLVAPHHASPDHADGEFTDRRIMTREEFRLQAEFGRWIKSRGYHPEELILPAPGGSTSIRPDLFIPKTGWIVEAKRAASRECVRMAIGQVLDYQATARDAGIATVPVILLPMSPAADLIALIQQLGITLIHQSGTGFHIIAPEAGAESTTNPSGVR